MRAALTKGVCTVSQNIWFINCSDVAEQLVTVSLALPGLVCDLEQESVNYSLSPVQPVTSFIKYHVAER